MARTCSWLTQKGPFVGPLPPPSLEAAGLAVATSAVACPERPLSTRGLPGTRPQAKPGKCCPFPGCNWEPLSQADPGAPALWAGTVTPAHPFRRWHVSCLAQRPPSVPIIGRTTRRVLLTPQPGQAQVWGGGPFHLLGPQLPFSLAWTKMFLNSISQGPRGPLGWGLGLASEVAHKGATSLLETRRKRPCLGLKIDAGPMVFWPHHPAWPWNTVILLWG